MVLVGIVTEFIRGIAARRSGPVAREPIPVALGRLIWRQPRRYGGYIVHLGVVMIFIGFAGNAFIGQWEGKSLSPGEGFRAGGYNLTFQGLKEDDSPGVETVRADVLVSKGGHDLFRLTPHRKWYQKAQQLSTEVAIYSTWTHDLYLILADLDNSGHASFKVYINPLVNWFWWGGLVICIGGILILLPPKQRMAG
jgi:cytochrome c-type biogenesis protein CcmF